MAQPISQHQAREAQTHASRFDVPDQDGKFDRPWFDSELAADYLNYRGASRLRSLYRFLKVKGVPTYRRGQRALLVRKVDLDRALMARLRKAR